MITDPVTEIDNETPIKTVAFSNASHGLENVKTYLMQQDVSKRRRICTQEEILQLMNKSGCELSDLLDDDNATNKSCESLILEGESSSN
ncbi:hypothetical protein TNCV_548581 [Trichonephila clavipes]|nr:hypothetical protein TNCV_548581 [Trichonephila clavipes]